MMMTLLVIKNRIKDFYQRHYGVVRGIIKACLMFGILLVITGNLDYRDVLGEYWLMALLAFFCGVTPDLASVLVTVFYGVAEVSAVSALMAAALGMLLLIFLLLFGRLGKYQFQLALAVPVLSAVHVGFAVPVIAALFFSPVMLPGLIMGVLLWYLLRGVVSYNAAGTGNVMLTSVQYLIDYALRNPGMYVTIVSFCLGFLCIYLIRRGKFKYGPQIAILVGTVLLMAVQLLSNIALELPLALGEMALQALIALALAYVAEFFRMTLDYHGTRKLQFEDDEYFYYVTAVPKFKVEQAAKTVTKIVQGEGETLDLKEELEKALLEEESETKRDGV